MQAGARRDLGKRERDVCERETGENWSAGVAEAANPELVLAFYAERDGQERPPLLLPSPSIKWRQQRLSGQPSHQILAFDNFAEDRNLGTTCMRR